MAPIDAEKRARLQAILEAEQAKSALAQKVRDVATFTSPHLFGSTSLLQRRFSTTAAYLIVRLWG